METPIWSFEIEAMGLKNPLSDSAMFVGPALDIFISRCAGWSPVFFGFYPEPNYEFNDCMQGWSWILSQDGYNHHYTQLLSKLSQDCPINLILLAYTDYTPAFVASALTVPVLWSAGPGLLFIEAHFFLGDHCGIESPKCNIPENLMDNWITWISLHSSFLDMVWPFRKPIWPFERWHHQTARQFPRRTLFQIPWWFSRICLCRIVPSFISWYSGVEEKHLKGL